MTHANGSAAAPPAVRNHVYPRAQRNHQQITDTVCCAHPPLRTVSFNTTRQMADVRGASFRCTRAHPPLHTGSSAGRSSSRARGPCGRAPAPRHASQNSA
eukprot:360484-Chlamydomonas_euryale.AAC.4